MKIIMIIGVCAIMTVLAAFGADHYQKRRMKTR